MSILRCGHLLIASILIVLAGAPSSLALTAGFAVDLEGWRVTGDNAAAWLASGGNPGGCLSVNDLATGDMNYAVAPTSFLGDWRVMAVTDSLTMDIFFTNTSGGALIPAAWLFRLSGPGGVAVTQSGAILPQSIWTHLGASLDPTEWTMQSGTWAALLENVDSVMIMGEYVSGTEIVRLDNISLTGSGRPVAAPCVAETFTAAGLGDWSFQDTGGITNPGTGGNTGGFCQISDGANCSYAFAPSRFLGNWSSFEGEGFLSVDVRIVSGAGAWLNVPEFIRLSGPGGVAVVPMNIADLPAIGRLWKTFDFPLQSSTWTMTSGTWDGLLANVTECRVQAEFMSGTDVVGLDNFARLQPECLWPDRPVTVFAADLEGWRVTGDNAAAWLASGGNPGGCLSVNDLATGDMNYAVAPPSFLGDWRVMAVTDSLTMDIFFTNTSGGALIPAAWLFRLSGPGGVAVTQSGAIPPQSIWTHLGASLDPTEWTMQSGTWAALLENVDSVMIMGEYVSGTEIVRLDNISLTGSGRPVAAPCVAETFTASGLGDWSFQDTGGITNPGNGGNTGGFCQISDGANCSYAFAPSRFLGNWSSFEGEGFLSVDVRIVSGAGAWLSVPEFIRLSGPGGVAVVPMNIADLPAIGRLWKTFDFPLQSSTWTMTSGTWDGLLANVTECRVQAEFMSGTDVVGLDNFARLTGQCLSPDSPVNVQAADVTVQGVTGFVGVGTVAHNPLDGQLYGTIAAPSGSGGGLWLMTGQGAGTRVQPYERPAHAIFDANGNGIITEDYSGNVYRRTSAGVSSLWVAGFHAGDDDPFGLSFAPAGFNGPNVSPGDVLVTDRGNAGPDEVWTFSAVAAENERLVMPDPGEVDFFDIAAGPVGVVYLSDALTTGTLSVLSPAGTLGTLVLSEPLTGLTSVVYDDAANRIYVTEQTTNTLWRIEADTGAVEAVASGFSGVALCGLEIDVAGRRLWVVDGAANRVYEFRLGTASAVGDGNAPGEPGRLLAMPRIWPNPSAGGATISFALEHGSDARLEIYDLAGRLVRSLLCERLPAGERTRTWDGRDANGRSVAAGLYLVRLSAGEQTRTARVAVVR